MKSASSLLKTTAIVSGISLIAQLSANPANAFSLTSTPYTSGIVTTVPGASTINFSGGAPTSGPVTFTNATVVSGSVPGVYANPPGNTSPFLAVGPSPNTSPVTVKFSSPADYFGLYWGSVDAFNLVAFFKAGTLVATYSGADVSTGVPNGDQGAAATNRYVNIFAGPGESFDQVVLSSSAQAFENTNLGYRFVSSVPEPSSMLGTFAVVALGAGYQIKRQLKKQTAR